MKTLFYTIFAALCMANGSICMEREQFTATEPKQLTAIEPEQFNAMLKYSRAVRVMVS